MSHEIIRLTVLVDNQADEGLGREHGLSIWIGTGSARILFDTGQGLSLEENARRLECDPARADLLVLSHGHYDHTGGIPYVLQAAPALRIAGHPGVMRRRFAVRPGEPPRDIAMPQPVRAACSSNCLPRRSIGSPALAGFSPASAFRERSRGCIVGRIPAVLFISIPRGPLPTRSRTTCRSGWRPTGGW